MATQIQVRRDTAANWTSADPTLATGEIGFETCLLYTSPSPRDVEESRMPSSA